MVNPVNKIYGIRDPTPVGFIGKAPPPVLPDDHPCKGCVILDMSSGKPYCFLPRCDRAVFELFDKDGEPDA